MPGGVKKIVLIAGDRSADLYGGLLCEKLKAKFPSLELYSFGGEALAGQSRQVINLLSHSVSGLIEVLSSLGSLLRLFKKTVREIERLQPDLVIPIDFPDFNLRLVQKLGLRFPCFYYISPQVWAWRKGRVEILRRYVKKVVVIFKFEEDFYRQQGIEALYFGHPLLEIIGEVKAEAQKVISFLPGSRANEVKKHLPAMLKAHWLLKDKLPGYSFRIIRPQNLPEELYVGLSPDMPVVAHSYSFLKESRFIVASSGTATIELAILQVPYVLIYKVNPLTWYIIRKLVKADFAGMVNILKGKEIVKELLQHQATPENIAQSVLHYLSDEASYNSLKKGLGEIKTLLGPFGATGKFADFIGSWLGLSD